MKRLLMVILIQLFMMNLVYSQELPKVTAIEIKGIKRIEEAAVKSRISLKLGDVLSQDKISDDIKSIYRMGYFEDVRADIEPFEGGVRVIFTVKEKPTIVKLSFEGNKEFDDDKLKEVITITVGAIADINLINDNALKLKLFYESEGYYFAQVVPIVKKKTDDEVELIYAITENHKVTIKEIKFEGNKLISSSKIKKVISTSERKFYSFITGGGYYKKYEIQQDIERIKDLYYDNGFLKVSVGEPKIDFSEDKKSMTITIPISEGPQYKVSNLKLEGFRDKNEEKEIREIIKLKVGELFSKSKVRKDVEGITSYYSDRGYALATVSPDVIPNDEALTVEVVYKIKAGEKFTVGRINISGNQKTVDKVIRREVRVDEGDDYSASKIKKSKQRLEDLQYFETVDINQKPDPVKKTVDLDITVKEKPTGFFTIGGGYSSIDNLIGMIDVTQTNLFGRGYSLTLRGELGGKSSYYTIAFRDPWFLDKPILFGFNLYRQKREYVNYTRDTNGASVTFGKRFGEDWSASVTYEIERSKVTDVAPDADTIIKDMEGRLLTSATVFQVVNDTRDSIIDPSRGVRNALTLTLAGLGGDTGFWKSMLDLGWYIPIFEESTLHLRGRIGWSDKLFGKKYPLYERFYIGGLDTIRGFGYGEAGPKDSKNEPIGAKKTVIVNVEYLFPIIAEIKLKGLIFFDIGRGYNDSDSFGRDLKYSTGFGFRWFSPMGPIKIDYGINLNRKEGEAKTKIDFGFGSFF